MPDPMTPAECDLQDFAFMPLDVARLRDSELASNETPEACWAAVLLWAASWHQVPAASIPNDEKWIAKAAGYALRGKIDKAWKDVRTGAMRGWIECTDGRLYHAVVSEKAREAWQAKLKQRWGSECARIKKHNERHDGANVPRPTFDEWLAAGRPQGQPLFVPGDKAAKSAGQGCDNVSKRQGEGQGQGQGQSSSSSDPYGSGGQPPAPPPAPPPKTPKVKTAAEEEQSRIWAALKLLLVEQGTSADVKAAGVLLGKHASKYGKDVFLEAANATVAANPTDAHTYLIGLCETAAGKRVPLTKGPLTDAQRQALNDQSTAEAARLLGFHHGETIDA